MHSFLSKVFGRKKDEKEPSPTSLRPGELLDGKFEAVSPNVSPSANNFLELDPKANGQEAQDKEKDGVFSLFRAKSRPSSPEVKPKKLTDTLPQLSLNFPGLDESSNAQAIDSLLELDIDTQILLSDAVIGQRRLNPLEAIILIRACSQAIISRGLETLGIMHPHWYSASPDIQRKLISQFIHTLTPQNQMPTPLSPTLVTPFETELGSRSPHDIAAILRWGLRHLRLDGEHFGTDEGWYKAFLDAEAAASYPPKAFSEKLAPKLPSAHLDLLISTLEIFSSLAAHAEENGTSGHKLSKIFGLWLLTARQVEDQDDWFSFYRRWERTGRMLEHLYLARIRDESADQRMPLRLLELVRKYPYTQGLSSPTTDLQLLPPSKFTTQQHDALFVRIEVELPTGKRKPKAKIHPLNLLADAFSINVKEGEFVEIWAKITAASKNGSSLLPLSNVFADETIRFLSIIPDPNSTKGAKSPVFSVASPSLPRAQSFSAAETDKPVFTSLHTKPATDPFPLTPVSASDIGSDWDQFSSSGFLDNSPGIIPLVSTLFDNDVEKTVPPDPVLSRKSSRRNKTAPSRKSVDFSAEPLTPTPPRDKAPSESEVKTVVRASKLEIIQIDEAFIDFWSDSLLDPITSTWPTFIICKFKSSLIPQLTYGPVQEGHQQKTMKWLVLEQVFTVRPPSPPPQSVESAEAIVIPASPTPSTSSRKRFSFFTRTSSSSSVGSQKGKKKEKALKIGEMGELLEEETSGPQIFSPPRMSFSRSRKSTDKKAVETVPKPDGSVEAVTEKPADAADVEPPVPEDSLPEAVPVATATAATVAAVGAVTIGAVIASATEDKPVEFQKVETEHKEEVPAADAEKEVSVVEDIPVEDKEADRKRNEGMLSPNAEKEENISQEVNDVQRTLEVEAETSEVESTAKPPGIEPIEVAPSVKEVTKSLSSSEDAGRIQEDESDIAHADFSTGAPSTGGIVEDAEQVVVPVEKIQEESSVAVDTAGVLAPPVEVVSVEAGGQAPITPDAKPTIANDNGHPEGSSNFVGEAFPEATESLPEVAEEAAIPSPAVFTSDSSDLENKPIVAEAKDSASLKDENVTESEGPVYTENIALQHTSQTEESPPTSVELDVVETAVDESIPLHSSELADDSGIPKSLDTLEHVEHPEEPIAKTGDQDDITDEGKDEIQISSKEQFIAEPGAAEINLDRVAPVVSELGKTLKPSDEISIENENANASEEPHPHHETTALLSSLPAIEPLATHEDPSDQLVDLPPVPIVETFSTENKPSHVIVAMKEGMSPGQPSSSEVVEDVFNPITLGYSLSLPTTIVGAGAVLGPQATLDAVNIQEEEDGFVPEEKYVDVLDANDTNESEVQGEDSKRLSGTTHLDGEIALPTEATSEVPVEVKEDSKQDEGSVEDGTVIEIATADSYDAQPPAIDDEPAAAAQISFDAESKDKEPIEDEAEPPVEAELQVESEAKSVIQPLSSDGHNASEVQAEFSGVGTSTDSVVGNPLQGDSISSESIANLEPTVDAASDANIDVAVVGELGGDATPVIESSLGLGIASTSESEPVVEANVEEPVEVTPIVEVEGSGNEIHTETEPAVEVTPTVAATTMAEEAVQVEPIIDVAVISEGVPAVDAEPVSAAASAIEDITERELVGELGSTVEPETAVAPSVTAEVESPDEVQPTVEELVSKEKARTIVNRSQPLLDEETSLEAVPVLKTDTELNSEADTVPSIEDKVEFVEEQPHIVPQYETSSEAEASTMEPRSTIEFAVNKDTTSAESLPDTVLEDVPPVIEAPVTEKASIVERRLVDDDIPTGEQVFIVENISSVVKTEEGGGAEDIAIVEEALPVEAALSSEEGLPINEIPIPQVAPTVVEGSINEASPIQEGLVGDALIPEREVPVDDTPASNDVAVTLLPIHEPQEDPTVEVPHKEVESVIVEVPIAEEGPPTEGTSVSEDILAEEKEHIHIADESVPEEVPLSRNNPSAVEEDASITEVPTAVEGVVMEDVSTLIDTTVTGQEEVVEESVIAEVPVHEGALSMKEDSIVEESAEVASSKGGEVVEEVSGVEEESVADEVQPGEQAAVEAEQEFTDNVVQETSGVAKELLSEELLPAHQDASPVDEEAIENPEAPTSEKTSIVDEQLVTQDVSLGHVNAPAIVGETPIVQGEHLTQEYLPVREVLPPVEEGSIPEGVSATEEEVPTSHEETLAVPEGTFVDEAPAAKEETVLEDALTTGEISATEQALATVEEPITEEHACEDDPVVEISEGNLIVESAPTTKEDVVVNKATAVEVLPSDTISLIYEHAPTVKEENISEDIETIAEGDVEWTPIPKEAPQAEELPIEQNASVVEGDSIAEVSYGKGNGFSNEASQTEEGAVEEISTDKQGPMADEVTHVYEDAPVPEGVVVQESPATNKEGVMTEELPLREDVLAIDEDPIANELSAREVPANGEGGSEEAQAIGQPLVETISNIVDNLDTEEAPPIVEVSAPVDEEHTPPEQPLSVGVDAKSDEAEASEETHVGVNTTLDAEDPSIVKEEAADETVDVSREEASLSGSITPDEATGNAEVEEDALIIGNTGDVETNTQVEEPVIENSSRVEEQGLEEERTIIGTSTVEESIPVKEEKSLTEEYSVIEPSPTVEQAPSPKETAEGSLISDDNVAEKEEHVAEEAAVPNDASAAQEDIEAPVLTILGTDDSSASEDTPAVERSSILGPEQSQIEEIQQVPVAHEAALAVIEEGPSIPDTFQDENDLHEVPIVEVNDAQGEPAILVPPGSEEQEPLQNGLETIDDQSAVESLNPSSIQAENSENVKSQKSVTGVMLDDAHALISEEITVDAVAPVNEGLEPVEDLATKGERLSHATNSSEAVDETSLPEEASSTEYDIAVSKDDADEPVIDTVESNEIVNSPPAQSEPIAVDRSEPAVADDDNSENRDHITHEDSESQDTVVSPSNGPQDEESSDAKNIPITEETIAPEERLVTENLGVTVVNDAPVTTETPTAEDAPTTDEALVLDSTLTEETPITDDPSTLVVAENGNASVSSKDPVTEHPPSTEKVVEVLGAEGTAIETPIVEDSTIPTQEESQLSQDVLGTENALGVEENASIEEGAVPHDSSESTESPTEPPSILIANKDSQAEVATVLDNAEISESTLEEPTISVAEEVPSTESIATEVDPVELSDIKSTQAEHLTVPTIGDQSPIHNEIDIPIDVSAPVEAFVPDNNQESPLETQTSLDDSTLEVENLTTASGPLEEHATDEVETLEVTPAPSGLSETPVVTELNSLPPTTAAEVDSSVTLAVGEEFLDPALAVNANVEDAEGQILNGNGDYDKSLINPCESSEVVDITSAEPTDSPVANNGHVVSNDNPSDNIDQEDSKLGPTPPVALPQKGVDDATFNKEELTETILNTNQDAETS